MSSDFRRDAVHGVPANDSASRSFTVLVVEADAVLRQFLRRLFERHGLEVLLSATPEQALLVLARTETAVHAVVHAETLGFGAAGRPSGHVASLAPAIPVVTYGGAAAGGTNVPAGDGKRGGAPFRANGAEPTRGPFDAEELARAVLNAVVGRAGIRAR
jgi:CheY-like chemotaxis protein